jgi:hypothetical protein
MKTKQTKQNKTRQHNKHTQTKERETEGVMVFVRGTLENEMCNKR